MISFEWNRCGWCGIQLAPDDFDGICSECEEKHEHDDEVVEIVEIDIDK